LQESVLHSSDILASGSPAYHTAFREWNEFSRATVGTWNNDQSVCLISKTRSCD